MAGKWKEILTLVLIILCGFTVAAQKPKSASKIYGHIFRQEECDLQGFTLAWQGFQLLRRDSLLQNPHYLTIVDYSKLSNQQRLFVIDVTNEKLVISSTASHGIGSDPDSTGIPQTFSNRDGSHATSPRLLHYRQHLQ